MKKVGLDIMLGRKSACHYRKLTPEPITLKLNLPANIAAQSPDLRTLLARYGLDTETVCKEFNQQTKELWSDGIIVPAVLIMNPNKSFVIELETPSIGTLINKFFDLDSLEYTPEKLPKLKYTLLLIMYSIALIREGESIDKKTMLRYIKNYLGSYHSCATSDITRKLVRKFVYKKRNKK